ncbi:protein MIZU-KUSSEI 1-like [Chenopodium quinoa]|uniref:Protein MIZU-KUSSEI 1 n=1 Tax=Chenopodium quinoa TaxID=63459 RepID=A0A803LMU6_CHEQI|nr:protein MIZU-KUSSEI 1-like [Chenopodium quinoa]XP_021736635.1 protein MIZU-KUSSEI 1-like [Chenopodium quinoa]
MGKQKHHIEIKICQEDLLEEESTTKPPLLQDGQSSFSLVEPSPSKHKQHKEAKTVRVLRSMIRSFPIISPKHCRLPDINFLSNGTSNRVTGTLFGYKKGKMNFSLQQSTKCLPTLVLDLPIQTHVLQKDMSVGMVRIALECEKKDEKERKGLLEEPIWDMFCNGKKFGYAVKRDANEMDLSIMEVLKVITMGVGVLPSSEFCDGDDPDDELAYIRANFDYVVGSKDSETLYMLCPEGNIVLDLSIFFVRI